MKKLYLATGVALLSCAVGFSQEHPGQVTAAAPERAVSEHLTGRYVTLPLKKDPELARRAATAPATVPLWTNTAGSYTYTMVGQNPTTKLTSPSTTISAPVIPLILTFSDGTVMDPTAAGTGCSASSPLSLMLASPIFNNAAYTVGGTSVGTTTYHDFFQRANYWQYTQPSGINPNYHMLLTGSSGTPVKITVPAASGQTLSATCGKRAEVDINFLDNYLLTTGFTQLAANGVLPSQLPVFLLYNTVMYQSTTTNCCILGYHSAFYNSNYSSALQTYAVADFDTTGVFGSTSDTAAISHEIGEWMDDPMGNNPTPAWGNVGQVTGCQTNLEVGDPLAGTDITVTMSNSYTYHLQELAFTSWFYRQSPSTGVNGWYSSNDTFKTVAGPCDPTTTTLSISPTSLAVGGSATVTATVTPTLTGEGTPTGTVALISSATGGTLATYTLSGTTAGGAITTLPAGTYNVTAKYSGDISFETSTSSAVAITVGTASVTFSPVSLTYASQNVGTSSAAQTITMKNGGTAPVTGIVVSLAGGSPGDYSQTNTCGTSLAASASCTISIVFKPTTGGTRTATLSVADSAPGSPQTVALSGTAVGVPAISLTPASLSFGSLNVGSTSAAQTVTLKNTGSAALTITSVSVTGANAADFPATSTCASSVAAGASCTISVTFKPSASGARTASLSVADNATGSPQTVALTGTGVTPAPAVTLSASSLAFGSVTSGSSSSLNLTVTNSGSAALTITLPLGLTGTGFTDTTTCTASLAAGANCTVTVTFKPTSKTTFSGTLSIADNATGSPQKVTLTGTGK